MRPENRTDFTIAIICALPLEAEAVEAIFDETYDRLGRHYSKEPHDGNAYVNGKIGNHNVVLCYMPGMGKGSAASVASSLQISYPGVELALVVGICGGAPRAPDCQEVYIGDVIISDSVIEYDFGRQYPNGFQRKSGVKDMLGRPNREIRALLNGLRAENTRCVLRNQIQRYLDSLQQTGTRWHRPQIDDCLFRASYHHKHRAQPLRCGCFEEDILGDICDGALETTCYDLGCDQGQIIRRRESRGVVKVFTHVGTVASADTVMKSGRHRDEIVEKEKIIGFEMEGAGVWDNFPCIIIKGVCDYADSHKSKSWQAYAAATGASAAKAFLEYWPRHQQEPSETRHFMVPFARNHRFVGRQDEIRKLEESISTPHGPKKLAIFGLGGVGKTQIALELAYRMYNRESEVSIFWIPCTSHEAIDQACVTIAQTVGIKHVKPVEAKDCIKSYFSQEGGKWLLIYDNADDMDMWIEGSSAGPPLKHFVPRNDQGRIIFTTRNRKLAVNLAASDVIPVFELDEKGGVEFLEKSLIQKSQLNDSHEVTVLLKQLTFLPLAIAQAAAYINENGIAVPDYLLLLQEQEPDIVELLSKDFGDDGRYKDVQNPVAKAWLISFHQIQKTDQLAADYLSLLACVSPRNIPRSFLPQPPSKLKMVEALGLLNAYSFITVQPQTGSINMHRLVYLATRNWMRKEGQFSIYIGKAADRLDDIFPGSDHTNRQLWREYLPHAQCLLGATEFKEQKEHYISYIHRVGTCLQADGRYNEAEELLVQVTEMLKQVLGPENHNTLKSMHRLSSLYKDQRRWKEAEELSVQVIKAYKQILEPEHSDTMAAMVNLAVLYSNQERMKEAEELLIQVLNGREQVLGPEHHETLIVMNNLATIYVKQGRLEEAEQLEVQVMETEKRVLGPDHPGTIASMGNLAAIYYEEERWDEAEELEMQVMATREQVLGPEHPDTLTSMRNLASTWIALGKTQAALALLDKSVELHNKVLGPDHPNSMALSDIFRDLKQ